MFFTEFHNVKKIVGIKQKLQVTEGLIWSPNVHRISDDGFIYDEE